VRDFIWLFFGDFLGIGVGGAEWWLYNMVRAHRKVWWDMSGSDGRCGGVMVEMVECGLVDRLKEENRLLQDALGKIVMTSGFYLRVYETRLLKAEPVAAGYWDGCRDGLQIAADVAAAALDKVNKGK